MDMESQQYIESSVLEENVDYYIKVSGTFSDGGGDSYDAAFLFIESGNPDLGMHDKWLWNGLNNHRPTPDEYNENHEYYKTTYKNKLKTETKKCFEEGIVITRYEYDSNNRLIRKYEIFDDKEIEQAWYEYDDKNKIIIHKSFLKGKLSSTAKIELKGGKVLLDDNDRLSHYATDWIKETTVDQNNELFSINYFTDGNVEKRESYKSGKLYSTIIYNPDTGEQISKTKHDSDVDEK